MMCLRNSNRIATAIVVLIATAGGALADPLEAMLAKGGGAACYERTYDDRHIAQHPGQTTRTMVLSLRAEGDLAGGALRIQIVRAKSVLYMQGDCGYAEKANLDVMGDRLIDAFKGPSGLDCHVYTSADGMSAEEGGDFPIDLRDGKAIVVYFPEDLAAWRSFDRSQPANFESFGAEDQVFKLNRTNNAACGDMIKNLPAWQ